MTDNTTKTQKIWDFDKEIDPELTIAYENDVFQLELFSTSVEHAKEYGLLSPTKPLFLNLLIVCADYRLKGIGKKVLNYIDKYAIKNNYDKVFGHIPQKAEFTNDNTVTYFTDRELIKYWLQDNGYAVNHDNFDFHKVINF